MIQAIMLILLFSFGLEESKNLYATVIVDIASRPLMANVAVNTLSSGSLNSSKNCRSLFILPSSKMRNEGPPQLFYMTTNLCLNEENNQHYNEPNTINGLKRTFEKKSINKLTGRRAHLEYSIIIRGFQTSS